MKGIVVVGAGGHGRAVAEAIMLAGQYRLVGYLDDAASGPVGEVQVLGPTSGLEAIRPKVDALVVAIGSNSIRQRIFERARAAGFDMATVVHPRASVSPTAELGAGSTIMAGAVVGTGARLGSGVIVNAGAVVDHDCRVADFGHLGVGACMAGGSVLGARSWMQAGSALGYGVQVDADAVLALAEGRSRSP